MKYNKNVKVSVRMNGMNLSMFIVSELACLCRIFFHHHSRSARIDTVISAVSALKVQVTSLPFYALVSRTSMTQTLHTLLEVVLIYLY